MSKRPLVSADLDHALPHTPPFLSEDLALLPDVLRYRSWLHQDNFVPTGQPDNNEYILQSLTSQQVGKHKILPLAPFRADLSAFQVLSQSQITVGVCLLGMGLLSLLIGHLVFLVCLLGLIVSLYVLDFATNCFFVFRSLRQSEKHIPAQVIEQLDRLGVVWPTYTVLCPVYKEVAMIPQFVEALTDLDYPVDRLQVLFLTEQDDQQTRAALNLMKLPAHFRVLTVPDGYPRTKPRACNFGLLQALRAGSRYVVIFDIEDRPSQMQLKEAILTFADHGPEVACVQAKLNYYNVTQTLLTRLFTAEYSTWFDIMLPGIQRSGLALPLGGTSNHFRTSALQALGGWDAFNVAEDAELGLRLARYGFETVMVDSTTYEEATATPRAWIMQRSRWIKGYLQTYLVAMRHPIQLLRHDPRVFFSVQLLTGWRSAVLLFNPFMWILTLIYLVARPTALYHELFPGPIFYVGFTCLVFGNFFSLYLQVIGCLKRREYALIKWVWLFPAYWLLMSCAAYVALYQLVRRPHHWSKTQHGHSLPRTGSAWLPLANRAGERRNMVASLPTLLIPAMPKVTLATTTQRVKAVRVQLHAQLPQKSRIKHGRSFFKLLLSDRWLLALMGIALIASLGTSVYAYTNHLILLYGDAVSHLLIARRVFDSATPGIAQLGAVWLPLPHILLIPFVQNNFLWQTGLAGSIVGMGCYLGSTVFVFLSARRITKSSCASFIGSLVFVLNPNVLYLQSTPLTEPVCWLTFTMACYALLLWVQEEKNSFLVLAAGATMLATLARYDGWILLGAFPLVIICHDLRRKRAWKILEGHLVTYLSLGSLGVVLWLVWNWIIFQNFLYFMVGPYSSQAQTISGIKTSTNALIKHHLLTDFRLYSIDSIETVGIGIFILALAGLVLFCLRRWKSPEFLASLAFLSPFVFYILALYGGQVDLLRANDPLYLFTIPASAGAHDALFNSRFGSEMVAPFAIFIAILAGRVIPLVVHQQRLFQSWSVPVWRIALTGFLIIQTAFLASHGVVSVLSNNTPPFCAGSYQVSVYLQEHYNGGNILMTEFPFEFSVANSGIDFHSVIYEGSGSLWPQALKNPASIANWVVLGSGNTVAQALVSNRAFFQEYTLVSSNAGGMKLYHKNGLPPLPTRPISAYLQSEQSLCSKGTAV